MGVGGGGVKTVLQCSMWPGGVLGQPFNVGIKELLTQMLNFMANLKIVRRNHDCWNVVGRNEFSDQLRKVIIPYEMIGDNTDVMRETACLMVNPITVNNFDAPPPPLFARRRVKHQT